MNSTILAQKMLETISKRITEIPHVVEPKGYEFCLEKNIFSSREKESVSDVRDALVFLEAWVGNTLKPYCALLGESGLGKTTACMLLAQRMLEKRCTDTELPLPLYLDLRHLDVHNEEIEQTLPQIIECVMLSMYGEKSILSTQELIRLVQHEGAVVIFDGLDEVLVHLPEQRALHFTRKLLSVLPGGMLKKAKVQISDPVKGGHVLLSCRTHYFRTVREQNTHFTMADREGVRSEDYCAFVLASFDGNQIREYLRHTLPHANVDTVIELIASIHNLSEIAERPYTLGLISQLIPQVEQLKQQGDYVTGATLYRSMVHSWLERDTAKHRIRPEHKLKLMEFFAAALWQSGKKVWGVAEVEQWFVQFFHADVSFQQAYVNETNTHLPHHLLNSLKEDLRTATFLVRAGESSFRFAHTSLQEFFLASYLYHGLLDGESEHWNMPVVNHETLDFFGQLFTAEHTSDSLMHLREWGEHYQSRISEMIFAYLLVAHQKEYVMPPLSSLCLDGADLKGWSILGVDNRPLCLENISFKKANLSQSNMRYLIMRNVDFSEADLSEAEITDSQAKSASFQDAQLRKANFRYVQLDRTCFRRGILEQAKFTGCSFIDSDIHENRNASTLFMVCEPLEINIRQCSENEFYHQSVINACVFSPNEQWIASASWDYSVRLWDAKTGAFIRAFLHQAPLNDCVFSPDGQLLVAASADATLSIWNSANGERVHLVCGHEGPVRSCAFSPCGNYCASTSDDRTIKLWNTINWACIQILEGHTGSVRGCVFSPDGYYLASTSNDQSVRLWNLHSGECIGVLTGHTDWVRRCAFSSDGRYLISCSGDNTLRIWSMETYSCDYVIQGHDKKIRNGFFSLDDRLIISSADDGTIKIWDAVTRECHRILEGHQDKVRACSISSSGLIVSGSDDQTLRLWELVTGKCVQVIGKVNGLEGR